MERMVRIFFVNGKNFGKNTSRNGKKSNKYGKNG